MKFPVLAAALALRAPLAAATQTRAQGLVNSGGDVFHGVDIVVK